MKILIFNTLYNPYLVGGAEISTQRLAESFALAGNEVAVVTLGECEKEYVLNNVRIYRIKIENVYWPFEDLKQNKLEKINWHLRDIFNKSYKPKLTQIILKFDPDIIHTNNLAGFSVYVWAFASLNNIKIAHTIRDYYLQCPKTTKFNNGKNCAKLCNTCRLGSIKKKAMSQKVDLVVGVSQYILDDHVNYGYFKNAVQKKIYNGFESLSIKYVPKIFTDDSYIRFGFIGQISESKGFFVLIESLKKLEERINWVLIVAGNITHKNKLLLEDLSGRVIYLGFVKTEVFYEKINVLIVPSIWEEPFGRVVIEGLLRKIIVLGSQRGGLGELLKDNDKYTFEPTVDSLSYLLNLILVNPVILNQFKFFDKNFNEFSIKFNSEKYLSSFEGLLK